MDKSRFFTKQEDDFFQAVVFGQSFKVKTVTAGDELDWADEYTDKVEVIDAETNKPKIISKPNLKKLAKCKLRNIIEVPFNAEELNDICGIKKDYKDFTNEEKDLLFERLNRSVFDELIKVIDTSKSNQKKE